MWLNIVHQEHWVKGRIGLWEGLGQCGFRVRLRLWLGW